MHAFIGSEAIASGALTRGQLRWNYTPLATDVYVPKSCTRRDTEIMAQVAWLRSKRRGVVSGRAAAALHGAFGIAGSPDPAVEVIATSGRSAKGFVVRHDQICDDEVVTLGGVPVTTAERTALDVARRLPRNEAVVILDQLSAATGVHYPDLAGLLKRYRHTRGIKAARTALYLMDAGARSPDETRVRLVLHDGGFPRPVTGIRMTHGLSVATVGPAWPDLRISLSVCIAVDERHPTREFRVPRRQDVLHHYEWIDIPIAPREEAYSIIHRARRARRDRGARV